MNEDQEEQFFEDVAKACPELMEKANIEYFGVGKGWHMIIEVLCNCIYSDLHNAKNRLRGATDYPRNDNGEWLSACEAGVDKALEDLPIISQVKEKFGSMRFYVHNGSDRVHSLIDFAEAMSARTCEECGKPGTSDGGTGWIKTRCHEHQSAKEFAPGSFEGRVPPNLFND